MKVQTLNPGDQRSFAVVLDSGEEVVASLLAFAGAHGVTAGRFTAIGAFSEVTLGFSDLDAKEYHRIPIGEQVEVVNLAGNFATRDGRAFGGHLIEGRVRPTLEVIVTDEPALLRRRTDPDTGLPLLDLGSRT